MKLDPEAHTVTLSNKDVIRYGKLLLATGANVRRLRFDGCDLDGIHYLRALGNADSIREDTENAEHVVLVGGSYIATEVAATLTALGRKCTIVMQEDTTLERTFGKQAGGFFQKVLEDHGVEIHGGEDVERFEGEGRVAKVVTKSGLEAARRRGDRRRRRVARRHARVQRRGPDDRRARRRLHRLAPADLRRPTCSPRATSPSTNRRPRRASGSGSSTGTSPRTRARPRRCR